MVSINNITTPLPSKEQDITHWTDGLKTLFTANEVASIQQACDFVTPLYAGLNTLTNISRLQHSLGVAAILIDMKMDIETIVAAILHGIPEVEVNWQSELTARFGGNIATLVSGFLQMEKIQEFNALDTAETATKKAGNDDQQIESLRRMLLAMVQDVRVVLIKLAERTQTLRCLSGASMDVQQQVARECQGIFAPLANRLGVWQLKWELEDLSLRYLTPARYKEVAKMLHERRADREIYINNVVAKLKTELQQVGIKGDVTGRPKHISSIVKKMNNKHLDFSQLYDVRAVRILVSDIKDCYTALGLIHNLWQPIPGEFDDYIARPKSNNYRSLHTAVSGPNGLAVEVQIRTHDMHHHSELGVAAHWRYKEGVKSDSQFDEKVAWMRQILAWKDQVADHGDMVEHFKNELIQDKVYALTPLGKVIDLPKGATPIDFAYTLHTDLGHRIRGAKINGSIVPLNTKLENGQRVEILTSKNGTPSLDWLNNDLGFLQSPSARAKVRHWFKYQHFDEDITKGRTRLDRELHRAGIGAIKHENIAHRLHFHQLDDLLAAIGRGDVSDHQLGLAIQGAAPPKQQIDKKPITTKPNTVLKPQTGIVVEGVRNLKTNFAKCCKPIQSDAIVGYLTRDHGVTIHRENCSFIARLPEARLSRKLVTQWDHIQNVNMCIDIEVEAEDRQGLLRDISDLFVREKINATKANTMSRKNLALMQFSIEVSNKDKLVQLLSLIKKVPDVITARRS